MPTIPQADLEQYGEVIDRLVTTPVGKSRGNMFQPMKAVDMYDAYDGTNQVFDPTPYYAAGMMATYQSR